MTSVKEATPEMFEEVYELLQSFNRNNPQNKKSDWESLFKHHWRKSADPVGYVLVDEGKIVGFLGTIWSHRTINGQPEDICNLTSWVVSKEHRQKGISLFMPVMKLKNCTITVHTPAKHVSEFYKKLGFQVLERKLKMIYPFPRLRKIASLLNFRIRATTDLGEIEKILRGKDADIFRDHRPFACRHMVIQHGGEYCYLVFKRVKGRRIDHAEIHYVSNPQMFLDYLELIKFHLFKANRSLVILIQSRLINDPEIPHCKDSIFSTPSLYLSTRLRPEQIDNLYSEHILLHL